MKLIFATHNSHKVEELRKAVPSKYELISLDEMGLTDDIPETGNTLQQNALIKARYVFEKTGQSCLADDTGLEVKALNGAPGVYSARYAGEHATFQDNVNKLLEALEMIRDREAQFRTVIAFIDKNGEEHLFEGSVKGEITSREVGGSGFGYDPIFKPEGYERTFAEMSLEDKNKISHRGKAVAKFLEFLNT